IHTVHFINLISYISCRHGGRPSKRNDKADTVGLLYREGYKIVDIVKQTGLNRATVYRTLKDLNI
ncbi:helix-turn-helix domain-containing protein, partial [Clostridium perfringens]|uniref:helix-turn-helix domain-containing protein n=1 Tax=Clostridium perfringens TaxID=1502 RepID=UPI0028CC8EE6